MKRLSHDRNGTSVFAARAQKNLDFIVASAIEGNDVHPVTQAVSALLGIVLFPWERSAFDIVKKQKLLMLFAGGWPAWNMNGARRVIELGDLIELLRNAIAHGHVEFDSDSRNPSEATLTFTNIPKRSREPDWSANIKGDQLIEFCRCFLRAIHDQVV